MALRWMGKNCPIVFLTRKITWRMLSGLTQAVITDKTFMIQNFYVAKLLKTDNNSLLLGSNSNTLDLV